MRTILLTIALCILLPRAHAVASDSLLVWPSPPDTARIMYVGSISSVKEYTEGKSFLSRIFSFFTGGERTPEWLVQPVGIAVGTDGRLLVADPGSGSVHIIDQKEREYERLNETKFGFFLSPVGIAVARDGRVYVSDSQRGDIIVFDDDLDAVSTIKDSIVRPTGLQIIGGKLYVTDTGRQRIAVFTLDGKFVQAFGRHGAGEGEFNYPVQLAGSDSLYVVDALNHRIQKFDLSGKFASSFGYHGGVPGSFSSPKSAALDSRGNVYVTDALMDNIQIFTSTGQLLLVVGRKGTGNGEFMSPGGIAIDANDSIYIVDTLNKRIQIFRYLR